jgi:hypothetical protein
MTISEVHLSAPFLFWTITIIASRWHPNLSHLYQEIEKPYRELMAKTLLAPILDLTVIQGLVLLCTWPLAVTKQIYDPSWNYCGLLTNAAMKLGIHKSGVANEKQNITNEELVKLKTWMACYAVNCSHSWHTGVSVPSKFTTNLNIPVSPSTKAESDFNIKVAIYRRYARSTSILARLDYESAGGGVVQIMCSELGKLRDVFIDLWNLESEILLLGSQLSLYAAHLEGTPSQPSVNSQPDIGRSITVNLAFTVAMHLIDAMSKLANNMAEDKPSYHTSNEERDAEGTHRIREGLSLRYIPKHYMLMLILAAVLIFKIKAVYPESIKFNNDSRHNHVRIAYDLLGQWSMKKDDEPSRAQRLIEVLSKAEKQHILNPKDLRTETEQNSGIRVLSDAILAAKSLREKVGIIVSEDGLTINRIDTTIGRSMDEVGVPSSKNNVFSNEISIQADVQESFEEWNFPWGLDIPLQFSDYNLNLDADFGVQDCGSYRAAGSSGAFGYYSNYTEQ